MARSGEGHGAAQPQATAANEAELALRRAQMRADLIKWLIGSVALTLITTLGNWTFQYFSFQAEKEKTSRELQLKEKDMQLQYLEKFTDAALDQDIFRRVRLAHYISRTIDDKQFEALAQRWKTYYDELVAACRKLQQQAASERWKL